MLDDAVRTFIAGGRNFAALTTLNAKGASRTQIMWVDADADHVLVNTEIHRSKYKDVQGDPRVTITVWDADNPYRYVEVRGRVTGEVRGDEARAHIDALSRRYMGTDYGNPIQSERIVLQVTPDRVHLHNLG